MLYVIISDGREPPNLLKWTDSSVRKSVFRPTSAREAVAGVRGVFYGWWLVGLSSIMLTLMSLTVFQGLGTMLVALERQFQWSRTALSGAFSLARVEGAVLGPIEGVLIDRIGTRRMVMIGYTIMGVGFIWLSQIESLGNLRLVAKFTPLDSLDESLIQFYLAYIFITLGSGLGGWLALIALVNNWFSRRRSFAMATAMSGIHLGGLLVTPFALAIDTYGFDNTALWIGVILLATVGPATKAIRNYPEDMGLHPDGDTLRPQIDNTEGATSEPIVDDEPEFTVKQALKTPAFWMLTIAQVASSVAIVTLALHLVPKLTDTGMSLTAAASVHTTYTIIALPAQFISGYYADRLPKTLMIAFFMFVQGAGILIIALFDSVVMAYAFAVLYGIGFGGRSPLTTAIRGEYFGRKAFATIMGVSQFPMNLAMIFAPLFAGYMFDTTGTYIVPFTTFAALTVAGGVLMIFVRRPRPPVGTIPAGGATEESRPDSNVATHHADAGPSAGPTSASES